MRSLAPTVVVTGAGGFLGSHLVKVLLEDRYHVICPSSGSVVPPRLVGLERDIELIQVDYADLSQWDELVSLSNAVGIAHLGWTGVAGDARNAISQVSNIETAARLASLAVEHGMEFFLSTGSQAEYGPKEGIISEQVSEEPTTLYGLSKLSASRICSHICKSRETRFVWMRVFSTYGPDDNPWWLIPSLITSLLSGERKSLTPGEQQWDYLHVDDAASAIRSAISAKNAEGVFNLGAGVARPLRQYIEEIRDVIDPDLELGFGEVPYRSDQVMHLEADVSRLKQATGWAPIRRFSEEIEQIVAGYKIDLGN